LGVIGADHLQSDKNFGSFVLGEKGHWLFIFLCEGRETKEDQGLGFFPLKMMKPCHRRK
jgi:hypothetical protein